MSIYHMLSNSHINRRKILSLSLPWLIAALILGVLLVKIPFSNFWQALARGPWLILGIYIVLLVLTTLVADGFAIKISLSITGVEWRLGKVLLTRGTTYILGLVNYVLGQGGMGYYLHRSGIKADRVTGIVLFLLIINMGLVSLLAAFGVVAQGLAHYPPLVTSAVIFLVIAIVVYLAIIAAAPRALQRFRVLTPLRDARISGHLIAAAGRLPHLFILVLGQWGALRLWGIAMPLDQAMILIPVVLIVAALPLTPIGLGTTNAAQVILFSPYAPYPTPEGRTAAVLAFSITFFVLGIFAQLLIGLSSWIWLRKTGESEVPILSGKNSQ